MKICNDLGQYQRRDSHEVSFGDVIVGGAHPIAIQSMANCSTMDTEGCFEQSLAVRSAGGQVMRFTAPSMREGENLKNIADTIHNNPTTRDLALVADIHFTPKVALVAAEYMDKVRINPGNFSTQNGELTDLIAKCKEKGVALRIGVNHGSLAAHIMEQYGDTPQGMVASVMEFIEQCESLEFKDIVISIKSSNVRVMVHAYRLLVATMYDKGMTYPLHLGVTEAGDALAARVKSAVGIGALLADGIGDTVRVSLTEAPQNEIPVGCKLVEYFSNREDESFNIKSSVTYSPFEYTKRQSTEVEGIGADNTPILYSELNDAQISAVGRGDIKVISSDKRNSTAFWRGEILNMNTNNDLRAVILQKSYDDTNFETFSIKAAADFGPLFLDGLADGIWIENPNFTEYQINELSLSILQASRVRISQTEYIACPGCGRTMYDLQSTLAAIKAKTSHLKGLKIGVMGCIVNGPGEMADADYGYVGSGKSLVTLYKGKEVMRRSIPEQDAIDQLIELIKEYGQWQEA